MPRATAPFRRPCVQNSFMQSTIITLFTQQAWTELFFFDCLVKRLI